MKDDRIQVAIAAGEKNQRTRELIHNWCRHARVKKTGGTGLVELQTGLPIGHHMMACDHAPGGGLSTWDLADAALHFYDRNCGKCRHRDPVRFPNLSRLVQQRDAARQRAEEEQQASAAAAIARRAARQEARRAFCAELPAVSASILDLLDELDGETRGDVGKRLIEMARLAPESFTPACNPISSNPSCDGELRRQARRALPAEAQALLQRYVVSDQVGVA